MDKFYLEDYLNAQAKNHIEQEDIDAFKSLCMEVYIVLNEEWNKDDNIESMIEIQKKAIIGHENEVAFLKDQIRGYLKKANRYYAYPTWYADLEDAIFHENWGFSGLAEWFLPKYKDSSSAKVIGKNIYFMENGRMVLKEQKIDYERLQQLVRALILINPKERLDKDTHEVYMLDGTRITIFNRSITKPNQDIIVFRRYIIPQYSFSEQVKRKSIPEEIVPLFKEMIKCGFNVAFTGAVRTAKTTFLSTWQSYEDKSLEGVLIETDPEIPIHKIMPEAPVMQILVDDVSLKTVIKSLLRSDADYFVFAEAREGLALDTAIKIANKGSRRMKMTFHCSDPKEFCYDVAAEIVKTLGGDMKNSMFKVAKSFQYIFHFVQLKDKNEKRLKGIYQLYFDFTTQSIVMDQICSYDYISDSWAYCYAVNENIEIIGEEENVQSIECFKTHLKNLAEHKPMKEKNQYIFR